MANLQPAFTEYSKFGNPKSDGKEITLSNLDKWLKQAGVTDGKKVTTTDTGILFKKFKARTLDYQKFTQFIESLSTEKKLDVAQVKEKLAKCNVPGTGVATKADNSAAVSRLTDTSKYTGTHKERFDSEGKGKGKEGREDKADTSGYVQGFKNKDAKDK